MAGKARLDTLVEAAEGQVGSQGMHHWVDLAYCVPLYNLDEDYRIDPLDPADSQLVAEKLCPQCPVRDRCHGLWLGIAKSLESISLTGEYLETGAWGGYQGRNLSRTRDR